ncbi:MAG: hypothetical protein RLZZ627_2137 [Pseudomonadota bacterium]|jgi:hypothetical protein
MLHLGNPRLTLGLVIGIASCLWVFHLGQPQYPLDDAYIVQHAAQGLLTGEETRFVGAKPIDGATSPIHLLLVTSLSLLLPIAWSQWVIGTLAVFAYLLGIMRLAHQSGLSPILSWLLILLSILMGLTLQQLMNGLETTLAMAAISWCLIVFRDPIPHHPARVLIGALPFVRPELGALSALLLFRWMLYAYSFGLVKNELPRVISTLVTGSAIPILFILATGGHLFPETASAKAYFFAEGCLPLGQKLTIATLSLLGFYGSLGLAAIGFAGLVISPSSRMGLGFICVFFFAFALKLPGALTHNWFRYPSLLMPFLIAGWIELLAISHGKMVLISRILLGASLLWAIIGLPKNWSEYQRGIQISRIELAGVSDWIDQNLGKEEILLIHDAGYISLKGSQPLVDLVGLKTPSSIEIHKNLTWSDCTRNPAAIDFIARRNRATYFVVLDEWDEIFHLTDALRATGWEVNRADTGRGPTHYKVYHLAPPTTISKQREL